MISICVVIVIKVGNADELIKLKNKIAKASTIFFFLER